MLAPRFSTSNLTTIEWSYFARALRSRRTTFKSTKRLKLSEKRFRMSSNEPLIRRCAENRQITMCAVRSVRTWKVRRKPRRCREARWRPREWTSPKIHPRKEACQNSMTALILWTSLCRFRQKNRKPQNTISSSRNSGLISKVELDRHTRQTVNARNTRKINKEIFRQLEIKLIKTVFKTLPPKSSVVKLQLT